ncbi:MAG TPA: GNAT family N-acetyltransferase [Longimicrobiaceae bacterium]|nr:GNAT family N-acetyltransferase [Longimicrobiaceae bacterium]
MSTIDLSELLKLSEAERIQLAQDLWDSIPAESDALALSEEQIAELDRRLAEHEADPASAISWEEARARLHERFGTPDPLTVIRAAAPEDAPVLARLRYEFRRELGEVVEAESAFVERCTAWMAERLGPAGAWRCWVAEREGEIVGTAWVQWIEKIPNPVDEAEHHAYITNCYVRPAARGGGIGSGLLEAALAWCRDEGVDAVILWPSARSRSLYLRHGFAARDALLELRPAALKPSA